MGETGRRRPSDIWIALNLAGELLLYYVEDMLLLRNIPDEFLLDQFPAHYGEFDTSWWWRW